MCGFAGFLDPLRRTSSPDTDVRRMARVLKHRGPDDEGFWADAEAGVFLAHRRLSVLDLSAAGAQPMCSSTGRYVVTFNGEIYNHAELRTAIAGDGPVAAWRGHSDTETLLALIERYGVERAVPLLRGMFAFGVWDRRERRLSFARDRIGEKPLYVAFEHGMVLFASEIGALVTHSKLSTSIDRHALRALVDFGYIGQRRTIYEQVRRVQPATILHVSVMPDGSLREASSVYWSAEAVARRGRVHPFGGTLGDAADAVEGILRQTIEEQLIADVPVGALLSGGVDSTLVTAVARQARSEPLHTFTIGFDNAAFDEAPHAAKIARHLQTEHHELYVTSHDALSLVPQLPLLYSEPFADSSQIPTILVSRLARLNVTVALSGDGGDELFGGYTRYDLARKLWRVLGKVPRSVRLVAEALLQRTPVEGLTAITGRLSPLLPRHFRRPLLGDDLHKGLPLLRAESFLHLYESLVRFSDPRTSIVLGTEGGALSDVPLSQIANASGDAAPMLLDLVTYLPDDILTKVDRAAMSVGLETRLPLLDHRMVEFAWTLPTHRRGANGRPKSVLRELLGRHVPPPLFERPKMGFAIPVASWLRGALRDWAESLLEERRLRTEGFFDAAVVRRIWSEHLQGHRDWQFLLWSLLMFQGWHERNRGAAQ